MSSGAAHRAMLSVAPAGQNVVFPVLLELLEIHLAISAWVELLHRGVQVRLAEGLAGHLYQCADLLSVERPAPILQSQTTRS